jgi:RNA polymerase sigma-70 factor (ECF subfamily)
MLFYRKYYYRQSTAQIAAELGMTQRSVEGRLYRIKQKLRKRLGGDGYA